METLKSFIDASHLNEPLIRVVMRQVGGWQSFKELANAVNNNGASAGFSGFIYYSDTTVFYAKNRDAILQQLKDDYSQFDYMNVLSMVGSFNCLKDSTEQEITETLYCSKGSHNTTVANGLAWYALEEVSRAYCDLTDANNQPFKHVS